MDLSTKELGYEEDKHQGLVGHWFIVVITVVIELLHQPSLLLALIIQQVIPHITHKTHGKGLESFLGS